MSHQWSRLVLRLVSAIGLVLLSPSAFAQIRPEPDAINLAPPDSRPRRAGDGARFSLPEINLGIVFAIVWLLGIGAVGAWWWQVNAEEIELTDRRLATILRHCQDIPGYELFQYLDDDGQPCPIDSADVNAYLREVTGQDFTAKDFRTWAGTLICACLLARRGDTRRRHLPPRCRIVALLPRSGVRLEERFESLQIDLGGANFGVDRGDFLAAGPDFGPDGEDLVSLLRKPALEAPESLAAQIQWLRQRWGFALDRLGDRLAIGLDVLKEDDRADWLRFHPVGPEPPPADATDP